MLSEDHQRELNYQWDRRERLQESIYRFGDYPGTVPLKEETEKQPSPEEVLEEAPLDLQEPSTADWWAEKRTELK